MLLNSEHVFHTPWHTHSNTLRKKNKKKSLLSYNQTLIWFDFTVFKYFFLVVIFVATQAIQTDATYVYNTPAICNNYKCYDDSAEICGSWNIPVLWKGRAIISVLKLKKIKFRYRINDFSLKLT